MIEAAIFDMGGVLIKSPRTAVGDDLKKELGIDQPTVDAIWKDFIPLLGSGKIDENEFWNRISRQHKIRSVSVDENLLGRAFIETLENNDQLMRYIKELGQTGIKLAVLSNTIAPHADPVRKSGLFDAFDYVFLSHEVGFRKPDPTIYQHAIEVMAVAPEKSIYVDDDAANVDAAEKLGLLGVVASDPLQVIAEIKQLTGV
jgi:epoxide hydrolase-like predicted phosphatase